MLPAQNHLRAAMFAAFCCACLPWPAAAEKPTPSALDIASSKASEKQVAEFKADEALLLRANPIGGMQLSLIVKALVLADPSLVDDLISLSKKANSPQAASIGAGIGQAVHALEAIDKALADRIATKVASDGSPDLLAGYTIGASQTPTYAVGGGGGTGGSINSSNGSAGGGSRAYQQGTSSYISSIPPNYSFGGATVTCSGSVSPSRSCN